ncbi:unnamed protein product [Paramecium sonneborni]|uniref:Proteasome subunit beta n=1 Tax=Paramecium sonneborni TaxID=65129 RepID=A0A8S1KCR5_9CILI|nr:unnamed protein product [Paramecium sonneborni]
MIFNSELSGQQQHTTSPVVTGGSVIALVYKGGVVIGTDTLCSYGSMAAFKNVEKIAQVSKNTLYVSSGEFSDFQQVVKELAKIDRSALQYDDGVHPSPRDYGNFLARLSYKKRCKINPLYLQNVIAGFHNGERYLALVDIYGTYLESNFVTTGFASYFCKAIISNYWNENCTLDQAKQVIRECFKVLFCRDCRAHDMIQLGYVDEQGVHIEQAERVETKWDFNGFKTRANEKLHTQ